MPDSDDTGGVPDLHATLDLPRVPQQARSRQKRDALLAAASRLFEEQGYEAVTADDIAAAAGVSIGTFYAYFRNKRQVFFTLYVACAEAVLALSIPAIDFSQNPREAIRRTVQEAMTRNEAFYGLRRAMFELLPRDPEMAAYNAQVEHLFYEQILAAARKLEAYGLTWPDLDLANTCWLIAHLLHQFWQIEPTPGTVPREPIEQRRLALADLIYHALIREA